MPNVTVGILTVSDSCFRKENQDISGKKLEEAIETAFPAFTIMFQEIVPDDQDEIKKTLEAWITKKCNLILTTGGTGFGPRDVTPEATKAVIEREAPGLIYGMISKSLAITSLAMLSRAVAGIKEKSLIINLPGSPKGALECFSFIENVIPHAIALVTNEEDAVKKHHHKKIKKSIYEPSKVTTENVAGRPRTSTYPLVEVAEAEEIVLRECSPTAATEIVSIEDSLHRILAEDVYSNEPIPSFDASMKDGYAVIASDGEGCRKVKTFLAAGDKPSKSVVETGEAVRICTGAPIPQGADAVVQVEDTTLVKTSADGTEEVEINIDKKPVAGQDIRVAGSDIPAKSKIFAICDKISPAHLGVLATIGRTTVKVLKRASIAIISTGNELVDYRQPLKPGEIRDCNRLTLINLLKRYNYASSDLGIARDNPNEVKALLTKALAHHDIVITSGGVSMGEFDLIKEVLIQDFDAFVHFGRVNMKPGKPTTFATLDFGGKKKFFFGLPGNPVSACVTCLLFVVPCLKYLERTQFYKFPLVSALLEGKAENKDCRPEYMRGTVKINTNGSLSITPTGNQISSRLSSLAGANGLLYLKSNQTIAVGYTGNVMLFDDLNS